MVRNPVSISRLFFPVLLTLLSFLPGCSDLFSPIEHSFSPIELEKAVFQLINQHRSTSGLTELSWNSELCELGRVHSSNMADGTVSFSHEGLDGRSSCVQVSIQFQKYAENVAYVRNSSSPARAVVDEWIRSVEHLNHIEGDFDITGVGVAESDDKTYYFTQILIKRR